MLCVLPPTKKTLQPYLLQDRFERQWSNRQHRYSARFAAMLQNKLRVFCCPSYCCSEKNKKQNNFARAAHFFVHFFAVVLHDYNVKLPSYTFCGGNGVFTLVAASVSQFLTAVTL